MNRWNALSVAALVSLAALAGHARDAQACAVFTPDQTVPVQGHRMILSLSSTATTLWDQFSYTGAPASFGWVLPIKGKVDVATSSDALFNALGEVTAPQVFAPDLGCPNSCVGEGGVGGGSDNGGGGVDVIAREVVGPYETVQLASQDPNALKDWLTQNGYPIPQGVGPILDAYVNEGFGFLALKLKPGQGVDAVRPVRVTYPGAAPVVPLRLLAAGTGEVTQVTLFVVSEGRYEPTNAPVVEIADKELVWDFKSDTSNYVELRKEKLAATGGVGWLVEQARQRDAGEVQWPLESLVNQDPDGSGYDDPGSTPTEQLAGDLDDLFGSIKGSPWIMRFSADLTRDAFKSDLQLGASASQTSVQGVLYPTASVNAPACPPDPCAGEGGGGQGSGSGSGAGSGAGGSNGGGANGAGSDGADDSGCSVRGVEPGDPAPVLAAVGLGLALAVARRRRRS